MRKKLPFLIIGLLLFSAGLIWFLPLFGRPLPKKSAETEPAAALSQQVSTPPARGDEGLNADPLQATATLVSPAKPACRGPQSLTLLVLGIDENAQADAIRLVRLDLHQGRVAVVAIPRDFYVPIVDMSQHGITQGRINATYGYGEWYNGRGGGIISVADNIAHNFGVTPDHYLVLSFANIAQYIDQVGGVEIELHQPVADGRHYFASGHHHLAGETAVVFMRMRYYDSDFARIRRQSLILRAFYNQVMDELNIFEQTQLAFQGLLDKNIHSDLAFKDMPPLICLVQTVDTGDVSFVEIPSELYRSHTTSGGANVQIPSQEVAPFIQRVMEGSW